MASSELRHNPQAADDGRQWLVMSSVTSREHRAVHLGACTAALKQHRSAHLGGEDARRSGSWETWQPGDAQLSGSW